MTHVTVDLNDADLPARMKNFDYLIGPKTLLSVRRRELNTSVDRAYRLNMSRIHLAVPADRMVAADALVREVPEEFFMRSP